MKKKYILFAGVNGAGKSSLYDSLLESTYMVFSRVYGEIKIKL